MGLVVPPHTTKLLQRLVMKNLPMIRPSAVRYPRFDSGEMNIQVHLNRARTAAAIHNQRRSHFPKCLLYRHSCLQYVQVWDRDLTANCGPDRENQLCN